MKQKIKQILIMALSALLTIPMSLLPASAAEKVILFLQKQKQF